MALNSKRMQTFFNEFLISTSTFLNKFMTNCETKFFEFERKLNRIESNLVIIEAKLASVPLESEIQVPAHAPPQPQVTHPEPPTQTSSTTDQTTPQTDSLQQLQPTEVQSNPPEPQQPANCNMIKISESFVYKKYFKMVKFGVPEAGVRNKMFSEGLDGNLIADPNFMVEKVPEDDEVVEE
ncbi:unnamed protein product [Chironomus riparius]|uniref:WASH complex subunit CCDC53 homolog n=1 Tax=Chironomus riparius TaxID=315576 RepID=A0A9N9S988_9DIPT|nr:unnamed protein product [Chironomus riparius]